MPVQLAANGGVNLGVNGGAVAAGDGVSCCCRPAGTLLAILPCSTAAYDAYNTSYYPTDTPADTYYVTAEDLAATFPPQYVAAVYGGLVDFMLGGQCVRVAGVAETAARGVPANHTVVRASELTIPPYGCCFTCPEDGELCVLALTYRVSATGLAVPTAVGSQRQIVLDRAGYAGTVTAHILAPWTPAYPPDAPVAQCASGQWTDYAQTDKGIPILPYSILGRTSTFSVPPDPYCYNLIALLPAHFADDGSAVPNGTSLTFVKPGPHIEGDYHVYYGYGQPGTFGSGTATVS